MRSKRRRRRKPADGLTSAERQQRREAYLAKLTPEQLAAYQAERDYVAYRKENAPIRYPKPPRSPSTVQAR